MLGPLSGTVHAIQTALDAFPADASTAVLAPFEQESSPPPAPAWRKPGSLRRFEIFEGMMLTAGKLQDTPESPASVAGAHESGYACAQTHHMPACRPESPQPGSPSMSLADVPAGRVQPGHRGGQRSAAPPRARRMKRRSRAAAHCHAWGTGMSSKAPQGADWSTSPATQRAKPARTWPGRLFAVQDFDAAEKAMRSAMHASERDPRS